MQRLGGGNVDSIGKGGDDESWAVAEIFVIVLELRVGNFNLPVAAFVVVVKFELRLPLEFVRLTDLFVQQTNHNVPGVRVEGNKAHDLLSHRGRKFSLHHFNQIREILDALFQIAFQAIHVALGVFRETVFHGRRPGDHVHKQGDLRGVVFDPLFSFHFLYRFETSLRKRLQRVSHGLDDVLEVNFHFPFKFQRLHQRDILLPHTRYHFYRRRLLLPRLVLQHQRPDGLKYLTHVSVHFFRRIPVTQNIQQIIHADEIKPRKRPPLPIQELIQGLLADLQILFDFFQPLQQPLDCTKLHRVLNLTPRPHNFIHILIDTHELLTFLRQFLLHLLAAYKKRFQETPRLLHFAQQLHDVVHRPQVHFPLLNLLLIITYVFAQQHVVDLQLVFFKNLEIVIGEL